MKTALSSARSHQAPPCIMVAVTCSLILVCKIPGLSRSGLHGSWPVGERVICFGLASCSDWVRSLLQPSRTTLTFAVHELSPDWFTFDGPAVATLMWDSSGFVESGIFPGCFQSGRLRQSPRDRQRSSIRPLCERLRAGVLDCSRLEHSRCTGIMWQRGRPVPPSSGDIISNGLLPTGIEFE